MHTSYKIAILLAVLFLGFRACSAQVQSSSYRAMLKGLLQHSVPEIQVQQAVQDTSTAVFLDARAWKEYNVSHIRGASFVGYDSFDLKTVQGIPKDRPVIVYCSVGYRSEKVSEKLIAAGYSHVYNLYGGIFEWVNQGYPVYTNTGKTTRVHAFDRKWGVWLRKGKKVY